MPIENTKFWPGREEKTHDLEVEVLEEAGAILRVGVTDTTETIVDILLLAVVFGITVVLVEVGGGAVLVGGASVVEAAVVKVVVVEVAEIVPGVLEVVGGWELVGGGEGGCELVADGGGGVGVGVGVVVVEGGVVGMLPGLCFK